MKAAKSKLRGFFCPQIEVLEKRIISEKNKLESFLFCSDYWAVKRDF